MVYFAHVHAPIRARKKSQVFSGSDETFDKRCILPLFAAYRRILRETPNQRNLSIS
jgi:hypothetical protein